MTEIFFDTETSSLPKFDLDLGDPRQPRIMQAAFVLANDGLPQESFVRLIKHDRPYEVDPGAQAIHGISYEQAQDTGIPFREFFDMVMDLAGKAGLAVAHNFKFDIRMWNREASAIGMVENTFRSLPRFCTMKRDDRFKHLKMPNKLGLLHQHLFGAQHDGAHGALEDALACMRCYYELMDMVGDEPLSLRGIF